jgi:hypothetical protein
MATLELKESEFDPSTRTVALVLNGVDVTNCVGKVEIVSEAHKATQATLYLTRLPQGLDVLLQSQDIKLLEMPSETRTVTLLQQIAEAVNALRAELSDK